MLPCYVDRRFTYKGVKYQLVKKTVIGSEAEESCRQSTGGTLARIASQEIQDAVHNASKQYKIDSWIAGERKEIPGFNPSFLLKNSAYYWLQSSTRVTF